MTTQEGNKLIAEFDEFPYKFSRTKFSTGESYTEEILPEYHRDWNLLMQVVEKIEKVDFDGFYPVAVSIEATECGIKDYRVGNERLSFGYYEAETKIKAVWETVIQFILWYNTNNPKTPPHAK